MNDKNCWDCEHGKHLNGCQLHDQPENRMYKPFALTSVCRQDLENAGYDTSKVEDWTMQELADKMGESIMTEFHIDLPIIADHLKIKKINRK